MVLNILCRKVGTDLKFKTALNTVMTFLNGFPMCLGLDELYRQMRMCQDVAQLHWIQSQMSIND